MTKYTKAGILAAFFWMSLTGIQIYADQLEDISETEITESNAMEDNDPDITYYSHVSMIGDTEPVENGKMTGTEGKGLQMEALCIELDPGDYTGDIEYCAHVENIGWMEYVSSSEMAGTMGQSKQMEAVKIRLTGELADSYDIYYSAHIAGYGWLGWACNDQSSGSAGYGKQMEALKILMQKKGTEAPVSNADAFIGNGLTYQSHVSNIGWMSPVYENEQSGTTGQGQSVEAVQIQLDNAQYKGSIEYSAYVDGKWLDYAADGEIAGSVGQSEPIEAVKIRLTDDMADHYDIYYRVHSSNFGWQGWTKDDGEAGTVNYSQHIEAIQLQLVSLFEKAPEVSETAFYANNLSYQAHVSTIGWMDPVSEALLAGTEGRGLSIEALKISLNDMGGEILYKTYHGAEWEDTWKSHNEMTGTTGVSTPLEAIQIKLSDTLVSLYDIFYRVHVGGLGWLDWVSNGALTGTILQGRAIEAIEISLNIASTSNSQSTITYGEGDTYYTNDTAAQGWQKIYGYDYYFEDGRMVTNQVVDGRSVGPDGRAYISPALEYARNILNRVGWNLRDGYDWIIQNNSYFSLPIDPSLGSDWYAQFLFENGRGNCYSFAGAIYEMGSLLGYEIHQIAGNYMTGEGEMPHSWAEVVIDGEIYILDPNFEEETHLNGYMISYGAPKTLRYMEYYRMN